MQRILSIQLKEHKGEKVRIAGWVHRVRRLKSVTFLIVRDVEGLSQVVTTEAIEIPEGSVVEVTGIVTATGQVELTSPEIRVLSGVDVPLPFEMHRPVLSAGLNTQLDHAALALRHPARALNLRIAAAATAGFRKALEEQRFVEIQTPKIVESATESGANVFQLDYFGRPAYLAQSPQFFKQLMVGVFERVFEVGPVFRAEPSDTARHLAQYTSLDAEMGFIEDHRDVMRALTGTLNGMFAEVTARTGFVTPEVPAEIPAVHFTEALRIAGAPEDEPDLAPAHERALGEWALREHGSAFVYVTGYPMRKRPFYTHPSPDPVHSNGFDLLFKGLEIVTGGQRLHRYEDYVEALGRAGEPIEPYRGYLDGFRYGMPPHGGWAIGLERLVARLVGAVNVREVTAFPRDLQRLAP
ncbi:aspartate--tRNA(Asn) ligase [Actinoplanes sp. NPDC023714]|uniref:aspartate--tRNA(Asn) ligase n=1 Tax=Actinoplanes sp. NPDC023714 TaxID=3154322 RepID=UPI0033C696E8